MQRDVFHFLQPVSTGLDVFKNQPKLAAWRDRIKQAVGETLFAEAHDLVMKSGSLPLKLEADKVEMLRPIMRKYFK